LVLLHAIGYLAWLKRSAFTFVGTRVAGNYDVWSRRL